MNNSISKNIRKYREIRGFSQEYMASQLDINQASYAKIESSTTKLTVDRLFAISKLLETGFLDLLDLKKHPIYSSYNNEDGIKHQEFQNLYEENKKVYEKLLQSKDEQIELLKSLLEKK